MSKIFYVPHYYLGQIVILDNYSIHTDNRIRELIEAKGCNLLFLPTYSPDLMPIENAFSKIKALLRKAQATTCETLSHAIKHACNAITLKMPKLGSDAAVTRLSTFDNCYS